MEAIKYLNLGVEKFKNKDFQGAIDEYTKAIELDPKFALAYKNRRMAYIKLKNFENAILDEIKANKYGRNTNIIITRTISALSICTILALAYIHHDFFVLISLLCAFIFIYITIPIISKVNPYYLTYQEEVFSMVFGFMFVVAVSEFMPLPLSPNPILVATSPEKSYEIQKFLNGNKIVTTNRYINDKEIVISQSYPNNYDETIKLLINSDLLDENVFCFVQRDFLKSEKFSAKDVEKWLKRTISKIDGVESVDVNCKFNKEKEKPESLKIELWTTNDAKILENVKNKTYRFLAEILSDKEVKTEIVINSAKQKINTSQ